MAARAANGRAPATASPGRVAPLPALLADCNTPPARIAVGVPLADPALLRIRLLDAGGILAPRPLPHAPFPKGVDGGGRAQDCRVDSSYLARTTTPVWFGGGRRP